VRVSAGVGTGWVGCGRARGTRAVKGRAILGITISHFASGAEARGIVGFCAGTKAGTAPAAAAAAATARGSAGAGTGTGSAVTGGGLGGESFRGGRSITSSVRTGAGSVAFRATGVAGIDCAGLGSPVRYAQVTGNRKVAPCSTPGSNVTKFSTSLL